MLRLDGSTYVHAKHSCYHCGSAQEGVDFEVHIEGEGVLYVCRACLTDAAKLAGIVEATADEKLVAELKVTKEALAKAKRERREFQNRLKAQKTAVAA